MPAIEATVAPLGTALTADQLGLLWKMADEPMLCFDGDAAGRRAAYRAVDLALPLIRPGKSLKFASLPEGQDPDDLVRSGGREAIAEVIGAARPLADVLWMRETEAGTLDTPERRAAFEARLGEVTATIGDDAVRKYYRREFGDRLRQLFDGRCAAADAARLEPERPAQPVGRMAAGPWSEPSAATCRIVRARRCGSLGGEPYVVASPQLAASPIHRGHRAAIPRREALILQAVINHPWLLHEHLEELCRGRVPPCRGRQSEERADRHFCPWLARRTPRRWRPSSAAAGSPRSPPASNGPSPPPRSGAPRPRPRPTTC